MRLTELPDNPRYFKTVMVCTDSFKLLSLAVSLLVVGSTGLAQAVAPVAAKAPDSPPPPIAQGSPVLVQKSEDAAQGAAPGGPPFAQ